MLKKLAITQMEKFESKYPANAGRKYSTQELERLQKVIKKLYGLDYPNAILELEQRII